MLRALLSAIGRHARAGPDPAARALNEAGIERWRSGDLDGAEARFCAALDAASDYAAACSNLGMVLVERGRYEEGQSRLLQAVELDPRHAGARINLANTLYMDGQLDQALPHYQEAMRLAPGSPEVRLNVVRPLMDACDWESVESIVADLCERHARGSEADWGDAVLPFVAEMLPLPADFRRRVAERWCARVAEVAAPDRAAVATARTARPPDGRIRIGYFSGDLRNHAVGHLTAGLFALHDRDRFEVSAYSFGADDGSEWRRRIEAGCDRFVDIRALAPGEAAARIAADGIDVLVDFGGHTGSARPEVLARRPAPWQITWGYSGTIGADWIDAVVGDAIAWPAGIEAGYRERILRMPHCALVCDNAQPIESPAPSRAAAGLPEQGFVFCGFSQSFKIDRAVFACWMRLLHAVPDSVLWLLAAGATVERRLRSAAAAAGIDPRRLVFAPREPKARHLARQALADLFLDAWQVGSGTVACDALWAGLPVLTLLGDRPINRLSGSVVTAAGLGELAAADAAGYEVLALDLARSPARLSAIRGRLRKTRGLVPLFDTAGWTADFEELIESEARSGAAGRA